MKVFCTGISGTGKKDYLARVQQEANERHGVGYLKVYNMGEMMFDVFKKRLKQRIHRDNILNVREDLRKIAVSLAFEEAIKDFKNHEHQILNSHEWFYSKKQFSTANTGYDLSAINPDMFITFISQSLRIQESLKDKPRWEEQNLSLDEILLWQNTEVEATSKSAEFFNKEHYIFSSNEPKSVLYDLIQNPRKELVYASFPMTNIKTEEGREEIDDFVNELREYFIVFDPRSIEVTTASTPTMKEQTVRRDLIWYISKIEKVVAIFPGELVYTAGAVSELKEAYETGKDAWVIGLKSKGPFEDHFSTRRFDSSKEFFRFLDKEYFKDKPIQHVQS